MVDILKKFCNLKIFDEFLKDTNGFPEPILILLEDEGHDENSGKKKVIQIQ